MPYGTLGVNREQWAPGIEASEREYFDDVLEQVLAELEPVALQEQEFCISFFQMDVKSPTGGKSNIMDQIDKPSMEMITSPLVSPLTDSAFCGVGGGDSSGNMISD